MKQQRKSTLLLSVLLALCIVFTGCSGEKKNNQKKTEKEDTTYANSVSKDGAGILADKDYSFGQVTIGGGGFVSGLISCPTEENLFFARTDVGGAYRWNEDTKSWKSLSYAITEEDRGFLSVDGLAVNPNAPNKVYMLCGCEYFSGGKTAVFISEDYGDTFESVDVTKYIKAHGNGMGRQNGERIAVDPNDGNILYVGGRTGGLIRSKDAGKTWEVVQSLKVPTTPNKNGVCSIVFDSTSVEKGSSTSRIFVGISIAETDNVYVTEDGGTTWDPVKGLPKKFMPQRMKMDADGNLLITYADAEGPWNGTTGALYRYNVKTGKATDISPEGNYPMGDVQADPENPDRLIASTINIWNQQANGAWGDIYFTSTDGGKTWKNVLESMTMSNNGYEWITDYAIHWSGSLLLDPFNTDRLFVASGNGIFTCDNIWDKTKDFYFNSTGIEETVPLDLVSVPDGSLYSALGDYSGFIHDKDVTNPGTLYTEANGSNYSISYAYGDPSHMVRINSANGISIFQSKDAGKSWEKLYRAPYSDGETAINGNCAISIDGSRIFWSPENGNYAYYTDDNGENWEICNGIASKSYISADPVNPDYIYASSGHIFYTSTDGGKTFKSKYFKLGSYKRFATIPGKEGVIYLPCGDKGLAVSTDHGDSFKVIENVALCEAVGLGKPATDERPYVIYLYGSLKDDTENIGIFASEDEGKTWLQLNEAGEQFGGPGNGEFLIGDNNIYGRVYMSTAGLGIIYGEIKESEEVK